MLVFFIFLIFIYLIFFLGGISILAERYSLPIYIFPLVAQAQTESALCLSAWFCALVLR